MTLKRSLLMAVTFIVNSGVACAADVFAGKRLFYDESQRSELEASSASRTLTVESPASEEDSAVATIRAVPVRHAVAFNGIVIRHSADGAASAIRWVNGHADSPSPWQGRALRDYRHRVVRFGHRLQLKLGQTRHVVVDSAAERHE